MDNLIQQNVNTSIAKTCSLHSNWIFIVCLVCLLLRIAYIATLDQSMADNGDGEDYHGHALSVLHGDPYPRQGTQPFMRPPFYVFWLVAVYALY